MNCYKAILQYDGTGRHGFQRQAGEQTIQRDLDEALEKLLSLPCSTRAASRTDIGVHAFAQVVKISSEDPTPLSCEQLNSILPTHLKCLSLTTCRADFIPSMDQVSKEYLYLFSELPESRYIAQAPRLNMSEVQECVQLIRGTHDFQNFYSLSGNTSTTVRHILECDLTLINPQELFQGSIFRSETQARAWQFRILGTGFLKHMVRHLVGALWRVGDGSLGVEDFWNYLNGEQKQQRPWKKADPRGLFLRKVSY